MFWLARWLTVDNNLARVILRVTQQPSVARLLLLLD